VYGDGDLDVLSASRNDDEVAWYENDGAQNFSAHTISLAANGAVSVQVGDVDGDGDLDVFSASQYDNKIAWYENDGTPAVGAWTARTITTAASSARSVYVADVDGDGDLDALSASNSDDKIAWYENDGTPAIGAWTARTITTAADGAFSVHAADVDGDGNLDVLSASANDSKISWYDSNYYAFSVSISTTSAAVAEEGIDSLNYTFNRVGSLIETLTLNFTVSGTAQFSTDYVVDGTATFDGTSGSVLFPVGASQVQVTVAPVDDSDVEIEETVTLTLLATINILITGPPSAEGFITSAESTRDYGDAPAPYPTELPDTRASHEAVGPTLGMLRDTEGDGTHSAAADADGADEDGVTFGAMRVGQMDAMAVVSVQNAASGAKLANGNDRCASNMCFLFPCQQTPTR